MLGGLADRAPVLLGSRVVGCLRIAWPASRAPWKAFSRGDFQLEVLPSIPSQVRAEAREAAPSRMREPVSALIPIPDWATGVAMVTGSRHADRFGYFECWAIMAQIARLPSTTVVMHGDCPTGADQIAAFYARHYGLLVLPRPADWSLGRKAGPLRNIAMVEECLRSGLPCVCLAFTFPDSRGSLQCMAYARTRGMFVREWADP